MKHKRIVLKPYAPDTADTAYATAYAVNANAAAASAVYAAANAAYYAANTAYADAYYYYYTLYPLLRDVINKNNYKTLPICYLITNFVEEINETN